MHEEIPEIALAWHRAGRKVALATVVETWGSAPRRTGSQLVVDSQMAMEGSVSGGCVEAAVITEAIEAMQGDGAFRLLEFGVNDGDAFAVGLACGGRIRVLVEPVGTALPVEILENLVAARAARRPVAVVRSLAQGGAHLRDAQPHAERFRLDSSGVEPDGDSFVQVFNPPLRMAIVGAVHVAQALVPLAQSVGHEPVVIDPRPAFADPARFPGAQILDAWPDEALRDLGLDARWSVITLTHDPKIDDPALQIALASPAYYIGALGSRRTQAMRRARLEEGGIAVEQLARIHGPVGLSIGAAGPAEIAVSIMAEVIAVLRKGAPQL